MIVYQNNSTIRYLSKFLNNRFILNQTESKFSVKYKYFISKSI
jgi:hypothetical protein